MRKPIDLLILELIYRNTTKIMAQIDDLNTAQTAEAAAVTKLSADVATGIATLQAAIAAAQAANPQVDLTAAIAAANALTTQITGVDSTVNAAANPAPVAPSP